MGGESAFALHEFWRDSGRGRELSRAEDSLLVADYKGVPIVIQGVAQEAKDLGLTELRLWNRVEFRLLEAGLRPAEVPPRPDKRFLYLELAANEDAFTLTLSFVRKVYFDNAVVFYTEMADVWSETAFGAHKGSQLEVVEQLDALLVTFLRSYLLANGP